MVASVTARFSSAAARRSVSYVSSSVSGASPAQHQGQLPGQVLCVGRAGVQTARPERAVQVRGIARQEYAATPEPVRDPLVEAIDGHPHQLVCGLLPDHRPDPALEAAVGALSLDIGLRRDLPVDAPHAVRLGMDQHLATGVPGWVEEEAPFVREWELGADVTDQEQVVMTVAREAHAQQVANRRMGAIGPHRVARMDRCRPVRGFQRQVDAIAGIAAIGQPGEPVAPAQVDPKRADALQEQLLDLGLADVHERRVVLAAAAGQLHAEQLTGAVVRAPDVPLDPPPGDPLADADPSPDLQRLALHAERLGSLAHVPGRLLEERDAHAVLGEARGQGQANRSGADDRDLRGVHLHLPLPGYFRCWYISGADLSPPAPHHRSL